MQSQAAPAGHQGVHKWLLRQRPRLPGTVQALLLLILAVGLYVSLIVAIYYAAVLSSILSPLWYAQVSPLLSGLWQNFIALPIPCAHYAITLQDVAISIAALLGLYFVMGVVSGLGMRLLKGPDHRVLRVLGWASAGLLAFTAVVPVLWFMAPAILHDARDAFSLAGQCAAILTTLRTDFSTYYWVPITLLFFVAVVYIYSPRVDKFYREVVFPRRTVWLTFAIVIFSTLWLTSALGIDLKSRAATAQPLLDHTANTAQDLRNLVSNNPWNALQTGSGVRQLVRDMAELSSTVSAGSQVNVATEAGQKPDVLSIGVRNVALLTRQLADGQRPDAGAWYTGPADETRPHQLALVNSIATTLSDLQNVSALPYFTVAVLYSVFLLLPWIIYVVYITARRGQVTSQTVKDLRRLGILDDVCKPAPSDSVDVQKAKEWRSELMGAKAPDPGGRLQSAVDDIKHKRWSANRVFSAATLGKLTSCQGDELDDPLKHQVDQETAQFIVGRAQFYSMQYLIPLGLFSIVSAIGWYYTFLAGTLTNLYVFIRDGGSTSLLSSLLMNNVTPFTAAFLGGWIFVIVMLLNCWTRDDLFPRTYFYAAAHLMIAMIVGFAFATALGPSQSELLTFSITLAALLISIVPYDSIGLLTQKGLAYLGERFKPKSAASTAGGVSMNSDDPGGNAGANGSVWISHELQQLPGATLWDETRLHQEGIDAMGDLAGASLAGLLLHTQYPGYRIAQWVDIALLRIHVSAANMTELAKRNVTTATDLFLAYYGKNALAELAGKLEKRDKEHETVETVVFNDIQSRTGNPPDPNAEAGPINSTLLSAVALERNFALILKYRFSASDLNAV
jgi:hypothetical protein